jgi:hypothetical protein
MEVLEVLEVLACGNLGDRVQLRQVSPKCFTTS